MPQSPQLPGLSLGLTPVDADLISREIDVPGFESVRAELKTRELRDGAPASARRSVPPELAYAIPLERLYWSLHVKGLGPEAVTVMPRAQRLAVRFGKAFSAPKDMGFRTALAQLEALRPTPALMPATADARQRAAAFERWMSGEVADTVMWCLQRPVAKAPQAYAAGFAAGYAAAIGAAKSANAETAYTDQFMTTVIMRALDVVQGLCAQQTYLFGDRLSQADITAAAVLAPVVRKLGWTWAGRMWTPLSAAAGRSALARHPAANWVRMMYDLHTPNLMTQPEQTRAWVP